MTPTTYQMFKLKINSRYRCFVGRHSVCRLTCREFDFLIAIIISVQSVFDSDVKIVCDLRVEFFSTVFVLSASRRWHMIQFEVSLGV